MIINALLEKEKMSRYRLSKESGVAMTTITDICSGEYYGAAEPPVRCGESHLSGLTEPLRL